MHPVKRDSKDYEKVAISEMLTGIIEECQYDEKYTFKGFQGKDDTVGVAIRFKLKLDGYKFPHYSRWMRLSTSEKSNLYKTYVVKLVEGAVPDIDMDLDALRNMKIKVIFSEENNFQNIDAIYPAAAKVKAIDPVPTDDPFEEEPPVADELP